MTPAEKLNHLPNYIYHIADLKAQNPDRWINGYYENGRRKLSPYNLPTFEYYLNNCVVDKGGKYDFTKRNYKSEKIKIEYIDKVNFFSVAENKKRFVSNVDVNVQELSVRFVIWF
jgi:hypothetical protein